MDLHQRHLYEHKKYPECLAVLDKLVDCQRVVLEHPKSNKTAETTELAFFIYMKGTCMERCNKHKREILEVHEEAIELEEKSNEEGTKKSKILAELYRIKGGLCEFLED